MFRLHFTSFLIAFSVLISGCANPTVDAAINNMIAHAETNRAQILRDSGDTMTDYKTYRDGTNNGVVFEYTYAPNYEIDRLAHAPEAIKSEALAAYGDDPGTQQLLQMGIYVKFIYKTGFGEVIGEAIISKEDL